MSSSATRAPVPGADHDHGRGLRPEPTIRAAIDVTPLIGARTGIGQLVHGMVTAMEPPVDGDGSDGRHGSGLEVVRYAVTARGRSGSGATNRPMPARPLHRAWERWDLPPIEWFVGSVDVVHGTNYVVPPARRAARVVSVHDLVALEHPEWVSASSRRFPALIERAVRRGAWVHCDSEHVAGQVRAWLGTDRVRSVAPGIPGVMAPSAEAATGANHEADAGSSPVSSRETTRRRVISLGTVEPRKDVAGLVRSFGVLAASPGFDDIELVVVGGRGWGSASATVDAALASLGDGVAARVRFTGYVSDDERQELLRGASVLAYPSLDEGFGFPPLEAMAAGVPVVTTAAGSLPEVLGTAALFVPVGDTEALTEGLRSVLADDQRAERLRADGRDRVRMYSWDLMAAGMTRLYRDAVADREAMR